MVKVDNKKQRTITKAASIFIAFWILIPGFIRAQMLFDTLDLQTVEIFSSKLDNSAAYKVVQIDTNQIGLFESQSLSELISSSTPVFVKSYGQGSLATSSIRGASATHTQVLWNGLNINSPMPGQADFSQVPVFFIDKASIYYGSGSIFQTSGGLGGSISLGTKTDWQNKLNVEVLQQFASFNTFGTSGKIALGNQKFQSSTRIFYTQSENIYDYYDISMNRENPPLKQRENAAYKQKGLLQEFAWKPVNSTVLWAKFWIQDNYREIPPNMLVSVPEGNEDTQEKLARGIVGINQSFSNSNLKAQVGLLYNFLNYKNEISQIDDDNIVTSSVNSFKYTWHGIEDLVLTTCFDFNHHRANSDNYTDTKIRNEGALCAGANYSFHERMFVNLLLRQELIDGKFAPFTPTLGVSFKPMLRLGLLLKANASRNFKAPSLNDLYWSPGGNPDLDNESGYSYELGIEYKEQVSEVNLSTQLTWFYNNIDNWIMWQPDSVFSYWTPSNLKNVVSKGVEFMMRVDGSFEKFNWNYSLQYAYTSAENMNPVSEGDLSEGKQLIYVPKHSLNQVVGLGYHGFDVNYTLNYTGERYTTSDNSRYLPAFTLHDLSISKNLVFKKNIFRLQFTINNLADKQYQVIAWQPMPGRNFSFSIKYAFSK